MDLLVKSILKAGPNVSTSVPATFASIISMFWGEYAPETGLSTFPQVIEKIPTGE
jgi:hypothetical protein